VATATVMLINYESPQVYVGGWVTIADFTGLITEQDCVRLRS